MLLKEIESSTDYIQNTQLFVQDKNNNGHFFLESKLKKYTIAVQGFFTERRDRLFLFILPNH